MCSAQFAGGSRKRDYKSIAMASDIRPPYPKPIFSYPRDAIDGHLGDDRNERWRLPLLWDAIVHAKDQIAYLLAVSGDENTRRHILCHLQGAGEDGELAPNESTDEVIHRIFLVAPTVKIVDSDSVPWEHSARKFVPVCAEDKVAIVDFETTMGNREVTGSKKVVVVYDDTGTGGGEGADVSRATLDFELSECRRKMHVTATGTNGQTRNGTIELRKDDNGSSFEFDTDQTEIESRMRKKRKMYPEKSGQITACLMSCISDFIQEDLHGDLVSRGGRESGRPLCFEPMSCTAPRGSRPSNIVAALHASTTSCACRRTSNVQGEVSFVLSACGRRLRSGPEGESGKCDVHGSGTIEDQSAPGYCCSAAQARLVCKHGEGAAGSCRKTAYFPLSRRVRRRLGGLVAKVAWAASCCDPKEARRRSRVAHAALKNKVSTADPCRIAKSRTSRCDWYETWVPYRPPHTHRGVP